jgi:DDE superfamily endonuclease
MQDQEISGMVKFGGRSFMMWGCMMHDGLRFACRIDGNMNAELYTEILDDELMQMINFYNLDQDKVIYAQDNDPKHTALKAHHWFQSNQIKLLSCPPQSLDLNPIKHIWHYLKCMLNSYRDPLISMQILWEHMELEWNKITAETCRVLIESMPRHMKAVIKVRGGYIKY